MRISSLWTLLLGLVLLTPSGSALAQTVDFEGVRVEVAERGDSYCIILPFAQAEIAKDEVDSIAADADALEIRLKSGKEFAFSNAHGANGFITIDYVQTGDALLTSEEPLVWELTCFKDLAVDGQVELSALKAYGTGGLSAVDGHSGSYAFLAVVEPESRKGVVSGWITSEQAGGVVRSGKLADETPTLIPRLDYGKFQTNGRVMRERFVVGAFDDCRLGLEEYAEAIKAHYSIEPRTDAILGYCTWYAERHGGSCDENAIKELARSLVDNFGAFGFQYLQIDSQWQSGSTQVGERKNFTEANPGVYPSGMKATADYVESLGLKAGLWLTPFSGSSDDPYFADKQDLFVKSAVDDSTHTGMTVPQVKGAPYETFWGGTPLDMSNPQAREYVRSVVERITNDWNFKYLKTDALWTGAAVKILYENNEYVPDDMGAQLFFDPSRTNIENFRTGLDVLRDSSNGAFILGSVASQNMRALASSYGKIDAMRIGPDNGADWERMRVGFKCATNRYFYNGRVWRNDPDPVYARTSIPLERAQLSASWTALTGQLFALGDWVPDYDAERIDLIRRCIPNHLRNTVRPVDLFDVDMARVWLLSDSPRYVVGLFNWEDSAETSFELTPEKIGLPDCGEGGKKVEEYVAFDFWNDRFIEPFTELKTTVPKESCKILAVRAVEERPILLSTSRHITQGMLEVRSERWNAADETLEIVTEIPHGLSYELRVYDPIAAELKRWNAPKELSGETTVLYDAKTGAFSVR
jgi:hypothetical protein